MVGRLDGTPLPAAPARIPQSDDPPPGAVYRTVAFRITYPAGIVGTSFGGSPATMPHVGDTTITGVGLGVGDDGDPITTDPETGPGSQ